jgi:hypothetical protein
MIYAYERARGNAEQEEGAAFGGEASGGIRVQPYFVRDAGASHRIRGLMLKVLQ